MRAHSAEGRQVLRVVTVAAALGAAWWAKAFYSRATFDELRWLLDPTVRLAGALGAGAFELEAHESWLSRAQAFAVVPACAGMNFMIAAFLSVVVGLAHRCRDLRGGVGLLIGATAAAYATTLVANALRIFLAVRLHTAQLAFGPFTNEHLHELLGISVYFGFLLVQFSLAMRIAEPRHEPAR